MSSRRCPALLVSAPASGQGKTSVTAALARWHSRQGRRVRAFKVGPDFLDPLLLEVASGHPVQQLDLWMCGESDVRARLHAAAADADLILVEGMMGLFDGEPSSADLAVLLGLPVLAVIDGSAMAQTFGAVAAGLDRYRPQPGLHGVVANGVGSSYHAQLLAGSLPPNLAWLGSLPHEVELQLPERHLGLVPAAEVEGVEVVVERLATAWERRALGTPLPVAEFQEAACLPVPPLLVGKRIAVARDAAFCFAYHANTRMLQEAGATLRFFSPLAGDALPQCDAVWLPGGFPELHAGRLSQCTVLHAALRAHCDAGRPLLAECGGMLFLLDQLRDLQGCCWPMVGVFRGEAQMQVGLRGLGLQSVELPEGTLRGHSFHHAQAQLEHPVLAIAANPNGAPTCESVWRRQRSTASFVHFYFPSNPAAAAGLFLQ